MKYITVLDFEDGKVYQYELEKPLVSFDICPYEDFLTNKGHNLQNCEWMVHEDGEIITK
tara:strand:- start:269 stop:445 length:177 start_codon:yes stop_codon:yes gene_type:complete